MLLVLCMHEGEKKVGGKSGNEAGGPAFPRLVEFWAIHTLSPFTTHTHTTIGGVAIFGDIPAVRSIAGETLACCIIPHLTEYKTPSIHTSTSIHESSK